MPRYKYQALTTEEQTVEGIVEASSLAAAVAELEAAGIVVQSIAQASGADGHADREFVAEPELATAVERAYALRDHFCEPLAAYLRELPPGRRRHELKSVLATLTEGSAAEGVAAAARNPIAWAPLLAACVSHEDDDSVFARFLDRELSQTKARHQRSTVMAYPLFIGGLTLLVGWPIAVFLLPTFREIYLSFGLHLPALTQLILSVGSFFERGSGFLLVGLAGFLYLAWVSLPRWAPAWLVRLGNRVVARGGSYSSEAATLTRVAANLVEAGLTPAYALSTSSEAVAGHAGDMALWLSTRLGEPPKELPAGSGTLAFAFTHEMPAATRATVLRDLSRCHEERAARSDTVLKGFAGPAATIAVGLVVGVVVIALFLPLVALIQGLT